MAAGLAPPTRLVRTFLAIVTAVVVALFVPAVPTHAHSGTAVTTDNEDGGKKKDKSSKKSHKHEKSSKDDDDDADDDDSSSSKGKRLDKDDDDDDSSSSKSKKSDDDDDDADDNDSGDDDSDESDSDKSDRDSDKPAASDDAGESIARVTDEPSRGSVDPVQDTESAPKAESPAPATSASATTGSLLASGAYLAMTDAVARARKAGAKGDVLQIDLEYDAFRGFATCDVTFTSGTEYEMNAETGEVLGEKQKAPAKLALLSPLATDSKSLKAFTEIIEQVSKATGQAVLEMEMKHPKGLPGAIFEVVTADGITSHFDAATGKPVTGM